MGKKFTIGLIYTIDQNWIAGTYYIDNLVSALKTLPEQDQPILKIYCYSQDEYDTLIKRTGYENCSPEFLKNIDSWFQRVINKFSTSIFKTHWFTGNTFKDVDLIFPNPNSYHFTRVKNKLYWIPDFQHKHYPNFFSQDQLKSRKDCDTALVNHKSQIVFSSEHARNDFLDLYPQAGNKLYVMPFAVTLPNLGEIDSVTLIAKYGLPNEYFICSNQFWAHKNHSIILAALKTLKAKGLNIVVAFTGKPFDSRNPDYYATLMDQVHTDCLSDSVKFLGFIPREDQLVLMRNSLAIIQPSLFEGWSTVVEDAKALGTPVIVSDIPVHREQLGDYGLFFDCNDPKQLADKMILMLSARDKYCFNSQYTMNISRFGRIFMNIVETSYDKSGL